MKHSLSALAIVLMIFSHTLQGVHADNHQDTKQVYKTVDENGKVSFSDAPQADSATVKLAPLNTIKPLEPVPELAPLDNSAANLSYSNLAITSPQNGSVISNGLLPFNVVAVINPALQPGHQLRLDIDQKLHSLNNSTTITVESIARGEHILQLVIIDEKGDILRRSKSISISALRPNQSGSDAVNRPRPPPRPTPYSR